MRRIKDKKPPGYSKNDFRFNIRNYMSYSKFLIWTSTLVALLIGSYYAFFLTPSYQAVAMLESQPYGAASGLTKSPSDPIPQVQSNPLKELSLVQAPAVMNKVMDQLGAGIDIAPHNIPVLGEFYGYFHKRLFQYSSANYGWFGTQIAVSKLDVPYSLIDTPAVRKYLLLTVTSPTTYTLTLPQNTETYSGTVGKLEKFRLGNTNEWINLQVDTLNAELGAQFRLAKPAIDYHLQRMLDNVVVDTPADNSNVVRITLNGLYPQEIAAIVNHIVKTSLEASKSREQQQMTEFGNSLRLRLAELRHTMDEEQKASSLNKSKVGNLGLPLVGKEVLDELTVLNNNIYALKSQIEVSSLMNTASNPKHLQLLEAYKALVKQRGVLQDKINQMPVDQLATATVDRNLQQNILLEQTLMQQLIELDSAKAVAVGDLRLLNAAEISFWPVSYSRPVILMLSLLFGLLLGYVLAIALD